MALGNDPDRISRYEIQALIARGGMARVYLARDPNMTRMVVVKLLDATFDSSNVRDRFDREARSLASLSHPNIVHIYDYGTFQDSPFIVMEYIQGETIEEKIKRRAQMSVTEKLRLMSEVCAGLARAHAAGVIHRDVKPANLMVAETGQLKIIDFGIARVSDSNLTRAQTLESFGQIQIGTVGYMSPEQMRGDEIDPRTDIFAVGAVCYELLAYREPFPGSTPKDVEAAVMRTPPPRLAGQLPGIDPEIDEILARAMARTAGERYPTVTALAEAFDHCRARLDPASATSVGHRIDPPRPTAAPRQARPAPPRAAAPDRTSFPSPRDSQPISVDPTLLIDRASQSTPPAEPIEPTMVIQRDDLMRHLSHPEPPRAAARPQAPPPAYRPPSPPPPSRPRSTPEPSGRQPVPMSDPTVMVRRPQQQQPPQRPVPSSANKPAVSLGTSIGAFFQRLKGTTGSRQPAKAKAGTAGQGVWTRGTLIAAGAIAVAALLVLIAMQIGRWWLLPSGEVLTVTKPVGGTLLGEGIRCGSGGSDCSTRIASGEPIELRADPDAKFVFSGFTGDCAPVGRTVMDKAKTCGATFGAIEAPQAAEFMLSIDKPTGGTVVAAGNILCGTLGSNCSAMLPAGVPVTLRVQTDSGSQFLQFTGDCAANGETSMTTARRCSATFTQTSAPRADVIPQNPQPPGSGIGPRAPRTQPPGSGSQGSTSTTASSATPSGTQSGTPSGATSGANPSGTNPSGTAAPVQTTPTPPTGSTPSSPPPTGTGKPAEAPISAEDHAKKEIAALVKQYCASFETLNAAQVEKYFPQIRQTTLKEQFHQYKSLVCTITAPPEYDRLDAGAAGAAQIKFGMKHVIATKSGGSPKVMDMEVTAVLSRIDLRSAWLIDRVRAQEKPKP